MDTEILQKLFTQLTHIPANPYHPLVWILGEPEIGEHVFIGGLTEIYAKGARVIIGEHCDIGSFCSINCADSHRKRVGLTDDVDRRDIVIEHHVFIGSHVVVKGGAHIGHHSVVAAGTVVDAGDYPPYSLLHGNPTQVKAGYYRAKLAAIGRPIDGEDA